MTPMEIVKQRMDAAVQKADAARRRREAAQRQIETANQKIEATTKALLDAQAEINAAHQAKQAANGEEEQAQQAITDAKDLMTRLKDFAAEFAADGIVIATPDMLRPDFQIAPPGQLRAVAPPPVAPSTVDAPSPAHDAPAPVMPPAAVDQPAPVEAQAPADDGKSINELIMDSRRQQVRDGLRRKTDQPAPPPAPIAEAPKPPTPAAAKDDAITLFPTVMPTRKPVKHQGKQPGRSTEHRRKTILLECPWSVIVSAVVHHLCGYRYDPELVSMDQRYIENLEWENLVNQKNGLYIVKSAALAKMINIPWASMMAMFAAMRLVSWSIRLVEPYRAHFWRLSPFAVNLAREQKIEIVAKLATAYHRIWPTPIPLKKQPKAIAYYFGNERDPNMQAMIGIHRDLGIVQVPNEPAAQPPKPLLKHQVVRRLNPPA